MSVSPVAIPSAAPLSPTVNRAFDRDSSFAALLEDRTRSQDRLPGLHIQETVNELEQRLAGAGHEDVVEDVDSAARQLVASTFIVPLLSSMRESPFAVEPFGPTMAERRMGPMRDQQVADRMLGQVDWSIIDSVKRSILNVQVQRLGLVKAANMEIADAG